MKKLLVYMKKYRIEATLAPFLKLCEALLELCIPLFVAAVIDRGAGGGSKHEVIVNCIRMLLFGAAGMILSVTSQYLSARAAVGFSASVRAAALDSVLRSTLYGEGRPGSSALVTRLTSDTDRIQNGVNLGLRLLLRSPFIVFGSVLMAFFCDVRTGFVFLAAVPVLTAVIFAFIFLGKRLEKNAAGKLERLTVRTRDSIYGVRVIRAFRQEKGEISSFDRENGEHCSASVRAGRFSSFLSPVLMILVNTSIIVIIASGTKGVDSGRISQGTVVSLYNYMALILTELVKMANLVVTLARTAASADRVAEVIELGREKTGNPGSACDDGDAEDKSLPAVEFENVSFAYPGASDDSLRGISFSLMRGESLGIIGGTGSGKSTLASLIPGLYLPTSGSVRIFGKDTSAGELSSLRSKIAFVPQKARLFSGSVSDNIRWGMADAGDAEIDEALRNACALEFVNGKPGGREAAVERDGVNFSGGQRQRLSIARALVRRPEILLLDDSFSALDMATDLAVRKNIAALDYSPAVVIISQRPSSIMSCDRILVLDNGTPAGLGSHSELLATCPLYREIYDSQYAEEAGE